MTWKTGLRPAMLGGVEFHCSDRGLKAGKALVVHEYPKRNSPYTEEMGRQARRWHVDAYVIGDDYMQRRDALISVCERPGTASYSDHWGRNGVVQCEDVDVKESSQEGRMAHLTLTLVEAGSAAPTAVVATAAALASAAGALGAAGLASFAAGGIVGQAAAGLGAGLQRFGVPAFMAARVVTRLGAGQPASLADAVPGLAMEIPARVAGRVQQEPR